MITVCIVNYNTPKLTECAIRSLWKHTPDAKVVVFDNSDQEAFVPSKHLNDLAFALSDNLSLVPGSGVDGHLRIIDNTKGDIINFDKELAKYPDKEYSQRNRSNFGSAKHTMSIDWLMDYCSKDGFVLADSDVLFRKDITPLVKHHLATVGDTQVKDGIRLIKPMLCWINIPIFRHFGIRYFNGEKMWALSNQYPNNRYDTGAWFYEEIIRHKLPYGVTDINQYILHFGHGSWKDKDPEQWLDDNKDLWI